MATEPTYDLNTIKSDFSSTATLRMTLSARQGAFDLGLSDNDVIRAIQALTAADFYKSMSPKKAGFTAMHDVYRPHFEGVDLYIKFQRLANGQLLLSFKEK